MEQGTCFYNLLRGHLTIEEIPEYYYISSAGLYVSPRFTEYGGHKYIAASHGVAIFSLPFYYFLSVMDSILSIEHFFIILWSILLAFIIYLFSEIFIQNIKKRKLANFVGVIFSLILLAYNFANAQSIDFSKWGPPMSIQFMSMFFTSLGLSILFRLFRICLNEKLALFGASLLVIATPVTFWGIGQKYHALNLSLLIFSLSAFYYGKVKSNERYHLISYVFAGLAIWVQLFSGIVIFLTLLLIDILSIKEKRLSNYSKILIVSILSLTPYFVENYVIYDNPLYPGYIAKGNKNVIPPSPPEIEILSPQNGEITREKIEIWYKVKNAENTSVSLWYNNSWNVIYNSNESEVKFYWNFSHEGIVIIKISAWNWRGDFSEKNISIIVDQTPPYINITSPLNDSILADRCRIQVLASGDVKQVIYEYSRDGNSWKYIGSSNRWFEDFEWNISKLQGDYFIKATAIDRAGFNSSDIIRIKIYNMKNVILKAPQDGEVIGKNYSLECSLPGNISYVIYQFYSEKDWQLIGIDYTPYDPFIWDTTNITYLKTKVRVIAYKNEKVYEIDENEVTIDNRKVYINISEPANNERLKEFAILRVNTSKNAICTVYQYSKDNISWLTAGYGTPTEPFLMPLENFSGKLFLRVISFSRVNQASDSICIYVIKERGVTLLDKIKFVLSSIRVGFNVFKQFSAIGNFREIPWKLYKSFFNAEGTDSSFAFFTFVPFLILSLYAPITYIRKKRKFGMVDSLMLLYIFIHLLFFVNTSTQQGGGYDVRFYLPLHIPFLYFSLVSAESLIAKEFRNALLSYLSSLVILLPVFIWLVVVLNYKGLFHLIKFSRFFGRIFVSFLLYSYFLWILWQQKSRNIRRITEYLLISFIGICLFFGSWLLLLTMIVYSRGIYYLYTGSNENFSMMIPLIKQIQQILQTLLR